MDVDQFMLVCGLGVTQYYNCSTIFQGLSETFRYDNFSFILQICLDLFLGNYLESNIAMRPKILVGRIPNKVLFWGKICNTFI